MLRINGAGRRWRRGGLKGLVLHGVWGIGKKTGGGVTHPSSRHHLPSLTRKGREKNNCAAFEILDGAEEMCQELTERGVGGEGEAYRLRGLVLHEISARKGEEGLLVPHLPSLTRMGREK